MKKDWLRYPKVLLIEALLAIALFLLRSYWTGFDVLAGVLCIILVSQILVVYVFTSKVKREENRKRNEYLRKGGAGQGRVVIVAGVDYVLPSETVGVYHTDLMHWADATDEHKAHIDQERGLVMKRKDNGKPAMIAFGEIRKFIMAEAERNE